MAEAGSDTMPVSHNSAAADAAASHRLWGSVTPSPLPSSSIRRPRGGNELEGTDRSIEVGHSVDEPAVGVGHERSPLVTVERQAENRRSHHAVGPKALGAPDSAVVRSDVGDAAEHRPVNAQGAVAAAYS